MTDLIVDNNSLQQLWRAGGADAFVAALKEAGVKFFPSYPATDL
jgi:hypothetical protein